jgi:hypothetical protein
MYPLKSMYEECALFTIFISILTVLLYIYNFSVFSNIKLLFNPFLLMWMLERLGEWIAQLYRVQNGLARCL